MDFTTRNKEVNSQEKSPPISGRGREMYLFEIHLEHRPYQREKTSPEPDVIWGSGISPTPGLYPSILGSIGEYRNCEVTVLGHRPTEGLKFNQEGIACFPVPTPYPTSIGLQCSSYGLKLRELQGTPKEEFVGTSPHKTRTLEEFESLAPTTGSKIKHN